MNYVPNVYRLLNQDVHCYGTHFAVSRAKYELIGLLASRYSRVLLEQQTFQTLQILLQLHNLSKEWKPRTARQIEQQKLASQLRSITGMIGQANYLRSNGNGMVFYPLTNVIGYLQEVEKSIRHLMKNIKERIPS